ncbi:MAG: hypothetical protein AAB425_05505, partial [Bdellovibrionota bacterium]
MTRNESFRPLGGVLGFLKRKTACINFSVFPVKRIGVTIGGAQIAINPTVRQIGRIPAEKWALIHQLTAEAAPVTFARAGSLNRLTDMSWVKDAVVHSPEAAQDLTCQISGKYSFFIPPADHFFAAPVASLITSCSLVITPKLFLPKTRGKDQSTDGKTTRTA